MTEPGRILTVIPARGGSKRLPRKNVLPLAGKPLICWTIEAALEAGLGARIMVTSDDDEILSIARRYASRGLIAHKRPPELATDHATTADALLDAVTAEQRAGYDPKTLILLQPTSPLRTAEDINRAIGLKKESGAFSVISVCECEHSPLWTNVLNEKGEMDDFLPSHLLNQRSQDLPAYYRINGAIYISDIDKLINCNGFFMLNSRAYIMPADRSIDIDKDIDFKLCELLLEENG